jgi:hypothetical protein
MTTIFGLGKDDIFVNTLLSAKDDIVRSYPEPEFNGFTTLV